MQKIAKMYGLCKIKTTPSDMKAKITTCLINNFFHLPLRTEALRDRLLKKLQAGRFGWTT